jgi:hypothetical protein
VFADYLTDEFAYYNNICRSNLKPIKTIGIWSYGLMGGVFCDFVNHNVLDATGNPVKTTIISSVDRNILCTAEPHKLNTGDVIRICGNVDGLDQTTYIIRSAGSHRFTVCLYQNIPDPMQRMAYAKRAEPIKIETQPLQNVRFEEIKMQIIVQHKPYASNSDYVRFDTADWNRPLYLAAFHRALSLTVDLTKRSTIGEW